jgi:hypothetical protein
MVCKDRYLILSEWFCEKKKDPNLYVQKDEEGNVSLISLYVDDLIITGSASKLIEEIKG